MKTLASVGCLVVSMLLCFNLANAQKESSFSGIYIAEPETEGDPTTLVIDMQAKTALLYTSRGVYRVGEDEAGVGPLYRVTERRNSDRFQLEIGKQRYQIHSIGDNRLKIDTEKPGNGRRFRRDRTFEFSKLNTENDDGTLTFINKTGKEANLYVAGSNGKVLMKELTYFEEAEMPSLEHLSWVAMDEYGVIGRFKLEGNNDAIKFLNGNGAGGNSNLYDNIARTRGQRPEGMASYTGAGTGSGAANPYYLNQDIATKVNAFREVTDLMQQNYEMRLRLMWEEQMRAVQQNVTNYHYNVMNAQFNHLMNGIPQQGGLANCNQPVYQPAQPMVSNISYQPQPAYNQNARMDTRGQGGADARMPVSVMFGNSTEAPLNLFAFDKDGVGKYIETLQPGQVSVQNSYYGQHWATANIQGSPFEQYTVAKNESHAHTFGQRR